MTGTRTRITRLLVAVVFAVPVLLSGLSIASLAAPSAEEVEAAKAKLAGLQHEFEVLAGYAALATSAVRPHSVISPLAVFWDTLWKRNS